MRIAVLMTCHNRATTTLRCLTALHAQCEVNVDVFLVDDGSTDGTGEKVRAWAAQNVTDTFTVRVILGSGNLFWCKGMRLAWDTAAMTADYDTYLWLNDDVELYPNALEIALKDWLQHSDAVLVGAFRDPNEASPVSYSCAGEDGNNLVPNGKVQRGYHWFGGNFVLVPRIVERRIGRLYVGYSHGYGDFDYAHRLIRSGIPFYLASQILGTCSVNRRSARRLAEKTLAERLKLLFDPTGYPLRDTFLFRYRTAGFARALLSVAHVVFMVVFKRERG